jgi:hypothetical protein
VKALAGGFRPVLCEARLHRFGTIATLLGALLVLPACTDEGLLRGSLVVEGSHDLGSGSGDTLIVHGRIAGDVLVFGGTTELGPGAIVEGSMVLAGGDVTVDPSASVRGGMRTDLDLLAEIARPAPTVWDRLSTLAVQALLLAAFTWLVTAAAPGAVRRTSEAVVGHAAVAGAMGVLAALVAMVLLVVMAFTVVLIPVTLGAALVLMLAVALGWIGMGRALAMRIARPRGGAEVGPPEVTAWTLVLLAALTVVDWIPLVGPILALLVTVVGFGAVLITGFGTRRFVPDAGAGTAGVRAGGDAPPERQG